MPQRRPHSTRIKKNRRFAGVFTVFLDFPLKGLVSAAILLLFLCLSGFTSYKIRSVAQDISMLEQRYAALQKEKGQLHARLSDLVQRDRLAKVGKRLGLHPPKDSEITTLP